MTFIRSPYNYDLDQASLDAGYESAQPSLTQQSFKDECDINRIVKQFVRTGTVPGNTRIPLPDEFVGLTDYHSALNSLLAAQAGFSALPSDVRARFNNDPSELMHFLEDKNNRAEAESLGLITPSSHVPSEVPTSSAEKLSTGQGAPDVPPAH